MDNGFLLQGLLAVAVPMWIERYRGVPFAERAARVAELGEILAFGREKGDDRPAPEDLLFRSKKPGGSAASFNALAEALAIMSFQPGGVRVFGSRWCAEHSPLGGDPADLLCPGCVVSKTGSPSDVEVRSVFASFFASLP